MKLDAAHVLLVARGRPLMRGRGLKLARQHLVNLCHARRPLMRGRGLKFGKAKLVVHLFRVAPS